MADQLKEAQKLWEQPVAAAQTSRSAAQSNAMKLKETKRIEAVRNESTRRTGWKEKKREEKRREGKLNEKGIEEKDGRGSKWQLLAASLGSTRRKLSNRNYSTGFPLMCMPVQCAIEFVCVLESSTLNSL